MLCFVVVVFLTLAVCGGASAQTMGAGDMTIGTGDGTRATRDDDAPVGPPIGAATNDPDLFNVRRFGATGDGRTDDSATIAAAAAAAAAASAAGQPATLYFPAGVYRLVTSLPTWSTPISVVGDGSQRSTIRVDPGFSGDVFSWSEVWAEGNYQANTISPLLTQKAGVEIRNIRIVGSRATGNRQNAFVFYDRADQIFMQGVDVSEMTGRALYSGVARRKPQAYMREAHFHDLRFARCGSPGVAVVEFNSLGGGDATNEVSIDHLDISEPFGTGVLIHNGGTPIRTIKFAGLRVAGQANSTVAADLVQVGDAASSGNVNNIDFERTELINPQSGFAAIRFAAPNAAVQPYQVRLQGRIHGTSAGGKGIAIDAGRSLFFRLDELQTTDVNVAIASAKTVGPPIVLDGHGQEAGWTRSIDPSSIARISRPVPNGLQQF